MRLFIAINFDENMKNSLCEVVERLKKYAACGKFTRRENLHLTLAFLGEITPSKVSAVKQAMDAVGSSSFSLEFRGLGKFKREGGDIYWVGTERTHILSALQIQLCGELRKQGFVVEERDFKPHLTLGREIILPRDFDRADFEKTLPAMSMEVCKISLMKSERVDGQLIYTEIYVKRLGGIEFDVS